MSAVESRTEQRFQFNLRQSIYGWGCLAIITVSIACLAYWIVSLRPSKADFETVYIAGLYLSADHGVIRVRDNPSVSVRGMLHKNPQFRKLFPGPALNINEHGNTRIDLPGFQYRSIEYQPSGSVFWMLSLSPFIPFGVTALLAGLCFYRYIAAYRNLTSQLSVIPERPVSN